MTHGGGLFILPEAGQPAKSAKLRRRGGSGFAQRRAGRRERRVTTVQDTKPAGLFVTDFDGTLVRSDGTVSEQDRRALSGLRDKGILRVVATGRSLYSLQRSSGGDLPVDYVVFSCGAGILDAGRKRVIRKASLSAEEVDRVVRLLDTLELDFMVHREIPLNHFFRYRRTGRHNPDFDRRIALYRPFSGPLDGSATHGPACQVLAVLAAGRQEIFEQIRRRLAGLSVIRTTSPLDHRSIWVEIFAAGVSKSRAVCWLCDELGIHRERVMAVGNDYNDLDLLEWAAQGIVVANAPADMRRRFQTVSSHDRCGVAEAISLCRLWDG